MLILTNFAAMKRLGWLIGLYMLLTLASCHGPLETQSIASLQQNISHELVFIDSLMWYRPDSAFWHIGHYFKPNGDNVSTISTRTEYDRHYAYLLLAELLFKNDYPQTNRRALLQAVRYFDSLTFTLNDTPSPKRLIAGTDPLSLTRNDNIVFLAARAHYMNGVGFQEQDSVIEAYSEYIRALEIMENHFTIVETHHGMSLQTYHIPRFMMLIHCRLGGLFSDQFMQEPAIYCFKKALVFNRLEPIFPDDYSNSLYYIGLQYDKLQQWDSAQYYYDEALRLLPDTSNWLFKVLMSSKANLSYTSSENIEPAVSDLKRIAAKADSYEKPWHFFLIGQIYYNEKQYDSALVYLEPTFEQSENIESKTLVSKFLHDIYQSQGDTLEASQYAVYHAEHTEQERVKMARVSYLNELFQKHLQKEQEAKLLIEQKKKIRTWLIVGLPLAVIVSVFVVVVTRCRNRKRLSAQEAEAQQRLNEVQQRHDEAERELQAKMEQAAQHTREVLQQRAMTIYQSGGGNRMKQILDEFVAVYPKAMPELVSTHPELSETERHIAILNFLRFRAKEEAELMGFTEYTALKYRSNLKKKAGSDPISTLFEVGKI